MKKILFISLSVGAIFHRNLPETLITSVTGTIWVAEITTIVSHSEPKWEESGVLTTACVHRCWINLLVQVWLSCVLSAEVPLVLIAELFRGRLHQAIDQLTDCFGK